jgi:hypothetical protein
MNGEEMAGAPFECLTALREIEGVARPTENKRRRGRELIPSLLKSKKAEC